MKKLSFLLFFILLSYNFILGQNLNKSVLLGYSSQADGDLAETIHNVGVLAEKYFKVDEGFFAIRVCSQDPLSVALVNAAGDPFRTIAKIQESSIPKANMYFLRQDKNCKINNNDYAFTDYWFISKKAEFPEFVEARKVNNFVRYQIIEYDVWNKQKGQTEEITTQSYKQALEEIVNLMKENKTLVVVIQTSLATQKTNDKMTENVVKAQTYLLENGIPSYRIYVKKIVSKIKITSGEKLRYPDIFIVGEN